MFGKEKIEELERRVSALETANKIYIDSPRFYQPQLNIDRVIYMILNHLKLKITHIHEQYNLEKKND